MVVLVAFTGLTVDVGYLQWTRLRIQHAADSAAQAALLEAQNSTGRQVAAGQHSAALSGYTNGQNGATVTINQPPTLGSLAGKSNAVEAIVTQVTPVFFMNMFNWSSVTISARSSGSYTSGASTAGCVYILDSAAGDSQVLNIQGSSPTFNCGVIVESPNSQAVYLSGALNVTMGTGYTLGVVGPSSCTPAQPATQSGCGIDYTSGSDTICSSGNSGCAASKEPTANGISSPGDPLSNLAVPSFGSTFSTKNYYDMNSAPAGNTLQPGIYCGGLNIGNTGGATYTLSAGTYIIAGGNLQFNSTGTVSGTGVTFYLTSPADVTSTTGSSCPSNMVSPTSTTIAKLNINGQPNVSLSAPASGATSGIVGVLMFENRNSTTDNQPQIVGNSNTVLNGALYFKKSTLLYSGVNGGSSGYTMIVVNKLTINGSSPVVVYNTSDPVSVNSLPGTGGIIQE